MGLNRATRRAHLLPYTLHPIPPPLLSGIPKTRRSLRWIPSQKIVSRGSSPNSPRRRNELGCNKTPSTISSHCCNGYRSPKLRRHLRTHPLLRQPPHSVSHHAD